MNTALPESSPRLSIVSPEPGPAGQLRFGVTSDSMPRVHVLEPGTAKPKERGKPVAYGKSGSVRVPIYGRGGKKRGPFTIAWREPGAAGRKRTMRAELSDAQTLADEIAGRLANGETAMLQFGEDDRASYMRATQLLLPTGKPLELAAGELAEAYKILNGTVTLAEACRWFMEHRPAGVTPKNVPDLVTLLLQQKRQDGNGAKGLRNLEHQLEAFAKKFGGPLHLARAPEINSWLRDLKVGLRTRKNYRAAVVELARFARANNFVSRNWDELSQVDKFKPLPTEAFIWTPDQFKTLLKHCHANLRPLLVLMAFGGIRHEEMSPEAEGDALLDWRNINLETGHIRVPKTVAKTKRMRLVKMQPNLIAWLRLDVKTSGPICELKCTGDALYRLGQRAGIPWVKNACRNSFISHRLAQTNDVGLVAREAGNSPKIIADEYLEVIDQEQGKRWFEIFPRQSADVSRDPLFAWGSSKNQTNLVSSNPVGL